MGFKIEFENEFDKLQYITGELRYHIENSNLTPEIKNILSIYILSLYEIQLSEECCEEWAKEEFTNILNVLLNHE